MSMSVVLQARVPEDLAKAVTADAEVLGLSGISEAIREGLVLLHRKARQVALGQSYDSFYDGHRAPVSDVTAALYPDED
ncbi:MAG: ribbon-helix-helix protein, CopG family [Kineosporiaceae bacterium]